MNRKMITLMVKLDRFGTYVDVPIEASPEEKRAAIAHNMQVTVLRRLLGERIEASARALAFKVHVSDHAVLLRGAQARVEDIDIPDCIESQDVREASERWNPRPVQ